jgi:hypothetical protein
MHRGIVDRRRGVGVVAEQHWRAEHAVARIDADKKIDRTDVALDAAELHAFDLARNGTKLTGRINLHLDPAAGGFFDLFLVELDELMLRLVDRRGAEFHDEIGGGGRSERLHACKHACKRAGTKRTNRYVQSASCDHCPHPKNGCPFRRVL